MLVRSIDDLSMDDIESILEAASRFRAGGELPRHDRQVVGLLFLETSLRTRVGFAAAAARLGASPIEVLEQRASAISMPESFDDTVRTLAGYCDVIVARLDRRFPPLPSGVNRPVISGGDRGEDQEHPTQALIDLFALRGLHRPLSESVVAVCGDLRMRAARSLLRLLARTPPLTLVLITEPPLEVGLEIPAALANRVQYGTLQELGDVDALYVAGIPHGAMDEAGRTRLRVTQDVMTALSPACTVLSPLPVIDEIEVKSASDTRFRFYEQSDDGLFVRMAVLDHYTP
jgi:aspartate carbamoyltransferase catalytic subunit